MEAFKYYILGRIVPLKDDFDKIENAKETFKIQKDYFDKALKYDQDFGRAWIELANLLFFLGEEEKMAEYLEKAMLLSYQFPDPILYDLKSRYFSIIEKNAEKVIKVYELWVKIQPNNLKAHTELAQHYMISHKLDEAIKEYLIALNMDPSNFDMILSIVQIYTKQQNFRAAQKLLKEYKHNYTDDYRPYFELGELYEKMGDFERSQEQYDTAYLLEPNIFSNRLRIIRLETKFGKFDSAISQLTQLTKDDSMPSNEKRSIYKELSVIYNRLGRLKDSMESAETFSLLEPG